MGGLWSQEKDLWGDVEQNLGQTSHAATTIYILYSDIYSEPCTHKVLRYKIGSKGMQVSGAHRNLSEYS